MSSLANKIAIITGASSGIGRATAKLFALEGAKVVLCARGKSELDAVAAEINDASSFTTGSALFADGGVSINRT